MSDFREIDRETGFLFPPSLDEWLPEQHLARFVVEVIDSFKSSLSITDPVATAISSRCSRPRQRPKLNGR